MQVQQALGNDPAFAAGASAVAAVGATTESEKRTVAFCWVMMRGHRLGATTAGRNSECDYKNVYTVAYSIWPLPPKPKRECCTMQGFLFNGTLVFTLDICFYK